MSCSANGTKEIATNVKYALITSIPSGLPESEDAIVQHYAAVADQQAPLIFCVCSRYSLGSPWYDVPTAPATFSVKDDLAGTTITSRQETPPSAPIGYTVRPSH